MIDGYLGSIQHKIHYVIEKNLDFPKKAEAIKEVVRMVEKEHKEFSRLVGYRSHFKLTQGRKIIWKRNLGPDKKIPNKTA